MSKEIKGKNWLLISSISAIALIMFGFFLLQIAMPIYLIPKIATIFNTSSTFHTLPCNNPISRLSLGRVYATNPPTVSFTTNGKEAFFIAREIHPSGILEFDTSADKVKLHILNFGNKQPGWNTSEEFISKTLNTLSLTENQYTKVALPSGKYWLWTNEGADIEMVSC